jgi:hypothetical protein
LLSYPASCSASFHLSTLGLLNRSPVSMLTRVRP